MIYKYFIYDVFTNHIFTGNQLAVIPNASGINETDLQKISREFNLSETVFVFPPKNPKNTAAIRIFDPTRELPFAGHPIIGTTVALANLGHASEMILELKVGDIVCRSIQNENYAEFTSTADFEILNTIETDIIADCITLKPGAISLQNHPPQIASLGLPFALIEVSTRKDLILARPNLAAHELAQQRYPNKTDSFSTYLYVHINGHIQARMFAPLSNIYEDPATGSAAATLGALLTNLRGKAQKFEISQGNQIERESRIYVSTTQKDKKFSTVTIGGNAVLSMQGTLTF